jgi:hypothetical protein
MGKGNYPLDASHQDTVSLVDLCDVETIREPRAGDSHGLQHASAAQLVQDPGRQKVIG